MMYVSWRYGMMQTKVFVILDGFLPFYPTNNTDNQSFDKMKKIPGGIITLNICTMNDNHITYGSQDKKHERKFFAILSNFMPFYSTNNLQNPNFEIMKNKNNNNNNNKKQQQQQQSQNAWRYYYFTYVYHNDYHLIYGS